MEAVFKDPAVQKKYQGHQQNIQQNIDVDKLELDFAFPVKEDGNDGHNQGSDDQDKYRKGFPEKKKAGKVGIGFHSRRK